MTATERAHLALGRRRWLGPILGIFTSAAVLTGIVWLAAGEFGLPRPTWAMAIGALVVCLLLEIRVQRSSRAAREPGVALLRGVLTRMDADAPPEAGLHRGLPWLSGSLDGRRCVARLDWTGGRSLRLALDVDGEPELVLKLLAELPEDYPRRWLRRLRTKEGFIDVPGVAPPLVALSPTPERVAALWAGDAAFARDAEALVRGASPYTAVLDFHPEGAGYDVRLTPGVGPEDVRSWVGSLAELCAQAARHAAREAATDEPSDSEPDGGAVGERVLDEAVGER